MASTYSITLLVLVISTLISSVIDPSDEVMVNYRNGNRQAYFLFNKEFHNSFLNAYIATIAEVM